jgi:Icc-related predicted phosphoesterase
MALFRRQRERAPRTRIFFATDVHGSERCFRKWLNAARVYEVQALVLGGDITGKLLVPIVAEDGGWTAEVHGEQVRASDPNELEELRSRVRMMGRYDPVVSTAERARLEDPTAVAALFGEVIRDSVERWMELLAERLADSGVAVYTMLGNDDAPELADVLRASRTATYAEDGLVELPGGFEMLSLGYSTPTPWHTPRELAEDDLGARIEALAAQLDDPTQAVFNLHCPPADTLLDQAPQLDDELRPMVDASGPVMASVGSTAVREAIERHAPLLSLHGHVHESPAIQRLNGTVCVNPGSDYGDGVLRGAIVELERGRGVKTWQLVQA